MKAMKRAMNGFLGTYCSRYSEWDGYWLFGFLVGEFEKLTVDLHHRPPPFSPKDPVSYSAALAKRCFHQQLLRNGISLVCVKSARLEIAQGSLDPLPPDQPDSEQRGRPRTTFELDVEVQVDLDGPVYVATRTIAASPHDPARERRSIRRQADVWPWRLWREEPSRRRQREEAAHRFSDELSRFREWFATRPGHSSKSEAEYDGWPALRQAAERVLELPFMRNDEAEALLGSHTGDPEND